MDYQTRQAFYRAIEEERSSKLIAFVTGDRAGMETQIAPDCVNCFVDLLDKIGPTAKVTLVLHTNGGDTLTAWRLVNLIRSFADDFEVIIPLKALSAGTLISIGADRVLMTKQAALGPIDPSVNGPLNPQAQFGNQLARVPVSVESVRGYLDAARVELGITGENGLTQVLIHLASHIHPLVIGDIFRSRAQIRNLAEKLLSRQVTTPDRVKAIIDFLCANSGSHDYTINRREANELGLTVEKPSAQFYEIIRNIYNSLVQQLKLLERFSPDTIVAAATGPVRLNEVRGLVESTEGGCYAFTSEGVLTKIQVQTPAGVQDAISDQRSFEGWKKIA